ncbi:hypothetical protein, partial [Desulfovirgula thermocuniculi]|uniref:hypothetical protein n=1 Tax=Desulfovirgula thermocuniculi TaxID=348842 RepID=UPI000552EC97
MRRKAFLGAFLFLSVFLLLVAVTPALATEEGGFVGKGDPRDSRHPNSDGVTMYVRQVPVIIYDMSAVQFDTEKTEYYLDNAMLVWGELWTKSEWLDPENPDSRFGYNTLFIPYRESMSPASPSGKNLVAVPIDPKAAETAETQNIKEGLVTVVVNGVAWGKDSVPALLMDVPLPSREAFLAQDVGVNAELAQRVASVLGPPVIGADGATQYYRAMSAYDHGALYYYSIFLNAGDQSLNYEAAHYTPPYYDEKTPTGKGFYRGREWSQPLENSGNPGAVPGMMTAVIGGFNLKLTGPTEIVGFPGEEKEATFQAESAASAEVVTQIGTKREGEEQYQQAVGGLVLPAWGKVPVTLKFKVEDKPYKIRVKINPNESLLESDYSDNYVDVVVKPLPPDFYIKIDPHQAKAQPGQELTFAVTAGLKSTFPQPWKALVRAFHVVNGVEYPAPLTLNGVPVAPDQPVEFQPGEEKQGTVTVHAQNVGTTVVVKINPVDTSEDADWSDNRDEARIITLVDVAVKVWPIKNLYVMSWYSSSLTPGVNVRVYRKDYGEPVPVKLTV